MRRATLRQRPEQVALLAVALLFVVAVLARTTPSLALGYDEAVYASQVSPQVPAAPFSAHRSRGMSLLLGPVAAVTPSAVALRVYLALLSGLLLYAAFRPWQALLPSSAGVFRFVPAVAAGVFASLWPTVLHAVMALPNLWLAFALTAGVGLACRPASSPPARRYGWWWWTVAAFAGAALLRPTDATAAAAPLLLVLLVRPARHLPALAAVAVGLAVGWGAWAAEAFARFGDPVTRLRGGAQTVGSGPTWNLPDHLAALGGPCPPPGECPAVAWPAVGWWVALPVLVGAGLAVTAFTRQLGAAARRGVTLAAAGAVAVAVPYLVLVNVTTATRLLLPSYALLAPAVAIGGCWLLGRRSNWARLAAGATVTVLVALHLAGQQEALGRARAELVRQAETTIAQATFWRDEERVQPPCLIVGDGVMQQGYLLRCRALRATGADLARREEEISAALARGEQVAIRIHRDATLPGFLTGWREVRLPGGGPYAGYRPS